MNLASKAIHRQFEFCVDGLPDLMPDRFGRLRELVESVIDGIEQPEVLVPNPADDDAFSMEDPDGALRLWRNATNPVNVHEWLGVVCQKLKFAYEVAEKEDAVGSYCTNVVGTILPARERAVSGLSLPGPAGFCGEITVYRRGIELYERERATSVESAEDLVSFIIAHELTHAFDMMKLVVPAFQNWEAFWENALGMGDAHDAAVLHHRVAADFLDDYETFNELASVQQYWPTKAEKWFKALRRRY